LPETRVWGLLPGADTGISGSCWITSTLRWGCEQAYDGTVSGRVVGLDYAKNRYYSSILGRFLSADPSKSADPTDPRTWNQYTYVNGDPVNFNDPSGQCPEVGFCWTPGDPTPSSGVSGLFGGDAGNKGPWNDPNGKKPVASGMNWASFEAFLKAAEATTCKGLPDGMVVSLSAGLAAAIGATGSGEAVFNFNTGQISVFGALNFQGG